MKIRILLFCILLLSPMIAMGADDDCDFDQAERVRYNLQLQKQYPGSTYIEEEYRIVIADGSDEISLNIGGCVHYGVSIELKTARSARYEDEAEFMKKIVALAQGYSQSLIKQTKLEKIVTEKNWNNIHPDSNDYYLLNYDDYSTFEVYWRHEGDFTIIGLYHYL